MRIRIIDAFTDQPFRGNPAAVCLLEGPWPAESWMQQVAFEMNLSETAFARPLEDGTADYALRWFTPEVEVDLCGHATLATAHALRSDGVAPASVRFATRSGVLVAHSRDDGAFTLDFPRSEITDDPDLPAGLAEALGAPVVAAFRTGALGDRLLLLSDEDTVRGLRPDLSAVARIEAEHVLSGVLVTAQAARAGSGYDFVSRLFAPGHGIPEDPVTGSTHTALAPFWARRLGRTSLVGLQVSRRTGVVRTELVGDRVHLTGSAVTVMDGALRIPVVAA
ncbi:PhzF family phenazine biosynthesis protein [Kibdelosporangium phytohabitans]|uniref:Oxidoreductase n=1 Tax=Kibdelosporangium phytohabitans TaxID=860235 RepID=A0A0N9HXI2_9PSEU|nr:PhzF family phenazine biosynthesis protein [Kibdelosporangium phytohabitans]ALG10078.1 oxidoreductase [Kibdelosporangium phytohabitans]MBE1461055.1 PhzF family phenazine biosynthesis protein [Kibdelosporangium phytohabitans]